MNKSGRERKIVSNATYMSAILKKMKTTITELLGQGEMGRR